MAEPKWTPGPWKWVCLSGNDILTDPEGLWVANVIEWPGDNTARGADAHLIAAAPELYEALASIIRCGELANVSAEPLFGYSGGKKPASKDVWQFPRHMLTKIDAALARARGENQGET